MFLLQVSSTEADCIYVGKTLLNFKINKTADYELIVFSFVNNFINNIKVDDTTLYDERFIQNDSVISVQRLFLQRFSIIGIGTLERKFEL